MKKLFPLAFAIIICLICSCRDVPQNPEEEVYQDEYEKMASSKAGMEQLLSDVYAAIPMDDFNVNDQFTTLATYSKGCDYSVKVTGFWDYDKIRFINRFIQLVDYARDKGVIDNATRDSMLGEAYFVRAYCYFAMVRCYGGVPLVTWSTNESGSRKTEKATWDFVISDLENAAKFLPEEQASGSFRATKWSALGLLSRVSLYAASVSKYWGKEAIPSSYKAVADKLTYMESSYADAYYDKCIEACGQIMSSGRFSLYGGASTSVSKSKENLTNLFLDRQDCEFIFGKAGEDMKNKGASWFERLYSPNQAHTPGLSNCIWGNYSVTSDMVDLFDNYSASGGRASGVVRTRNDGKENIYFSVVISSNTTFDSFADFIKYNNPQDPFLNKDARFHAWVLYPGAEFRGITITAQGGIWRPGKTYPFFYDNSEFSFNGTTYYGLGGDEDNISAFHHLGSIQPNNASRYWNCCCGIRKFLNPTEAITLSNTPWCDIRYAEILLNYAEAYAESGKGDAATAKKVLNDIRHRAAFTDNIEPTLENVIHERQVEFAFEGHESYTLHRRRAYLNTRSGQEYRKHTLAPVLDLRDGTPKYIFPRVDVFDGDAYYSLKGLDTGLLDYYAAIPDPTLVVNPIQE